MCRLRLKSNLLFLGVFFSGTLLQGQEKWAEDQLGAALTPLISSALKPRTPEFERLEFLGDRVLGLIVASYLYERFPHEAAVKLTQLFEIVVSRELLAMIYRSIAIDPRWHISVHYQAPQSTPIAQKTASDVIEALMSALYKGNGFEFARNYMYKILDEYFDDKDGQTDHVSLGSQAGKHKPTVDKVASLQEELCYTFKDIGLLQQAFWHPSVGGLFFSTLDFLGIRVLGLFLAQDVFNSHRHADAGELTDHFINLVSPDNLERVFYTWHLDAYLSSQYGKTIAINRLAKLICHDTSPVNLREYIPKRVAASVVRALVAAIYLDSNWDTASTVADALFFSNPRFYKSVMGSIRSLAISDDNTENAEKKSARYYRA